MMNRRLFAASTAACIVVTAVYPMTSLAAVNMDLKKKVVGMAGIMNVTNTEKNVTRAEYAKMVVLASPYGSSVPPKAAAPSSRMSERITPTPPISKRRWKKAI